jgi:hypothetical protein
MNKPFWESPHIVSGLCESLKTASLYKNWILKEIQAQLGNNPFRSKGVPSVKLPDAPVAAGKEGGEDVLTKSRT